MILVRKLIDGLKPFYPPGREPGQGRPGLTLAECKSLGKELLKAWKADQARLRREAKKAATAVRKLAEKEAKAAARAAAKKA